VTNCRFQRMNCVPRRRTARSPGPGSYRDTPWRVNASNAAGTRPGCFAACS
jgi:hypothetical protein